MCRDLKPHNFLVKKKRGMIKIVDLGLGRDFIVHVKEYIHEVNVFMYFLTLEGFFDTGLGMQLVSPFSGSFNYFLTLV